LQTIAAVISAVISWAARRILVAEVDTPRQRLLLRNGLDNQNDEFLPDFLAVAVRSPSGRLDRFQEHHIDGNSLLERLDGAVLYKQRRDIWVNS
jgi:hypothetical protein